MRNTCDCSNRFENTISAGEYQKNPKVLRQVARQKSLVNLEFMVNELIALYEPS